jgi:hypothetical protein
MIALTRNLYVFGSGLATSVSAILFSIYDFASARNVRAFPRLLVFHDDSFNGRVLRFFDIRTGPQTFSPRPATDLLGCPVRFRDRSPRCTQSAIARASFVRPLLLHLQVKYLDPVGFRGSQIFPALPTVSQMSIFRPSSVTHGIRRATGFDTFDTEGVSVWRP